MSKAKTSSPVTWDKIEIVLDSREAHLKKELESKDTPFVTEQLAVGDIIFREKVSGKMLLVCERKTSSDLYSSIISGRYREQRERLKVTKASDVKVIYILEGYTDKSRTANEGNVISGALENLVLYHNIPILPTVSVAQTAKAVANIAQKLAKTPMTPPSDGTGGSENPAVIGIMTGRKDKMMKHMFEHQLLLIPGVSAGVAKAIAEKYPTVRSLIEKYDAINEDQAKYNLLSEISLGKKKLGKVLSKRIALVYTSKD